MKLTGGIHCASNCTLTITGTGELTITAPGNNNAGIGGNGSETTGTINIIGGTVSATGGTNGGAGIGSGYGGNSGIINISDNAIIKLAQGNFQSAGIGAGYNGAVGTINISGNARITDAHGGDEGAGIGGGMGATSGTINISGNAIITQAISGFQGAGIGGGSGGAGGTIKIEGGTISATGGQFGAGIGGGQSGDGGKITISGGEITAKGGQFGAGIGGGLNGAGGTIKIEGGTISAQGGSAAAGIGGGRGLGGGGTITISGGIIQSAIGGDSGGAGIGGGMGGSGGTIKIEGGTIISAVGSTTPGYIGAGIGVGYNYNNDGTTKITGGSINANLMFPNPTSDGSSNTVYKNTLTLPEQFEEVLVTKYYDSSYGINDVYTDLTHKLYFYLPQISGDELVALSFDEITGTEPYYGAKYLRGTSANTEDLDYLQLAIPNAAIDYTNEILTGLKPETNYNISITEPLAPESFSLKPLSATLADGAGTTPIDESWIGQDVDIVQTYITPFGDSDPQIRNIPARPDASDDLKALASTSPKSEGASGKVSGLKSGMAYSTNPNASPDEWITVDSEDDLELAPGTYYFREIATGDAFATEAVEVVIPVYLAPVAPDSPAELDLVATGLNLDLAYLLMVLLLAFGTVLKKRVIPAEAGIHRD